MAQGVIGLGELTGQHICETEGVILHGNSRGGPCYWRVDDAAAEPYLWHFCPYCGMPLPTRGIDLRDAIMWPEEPAKARTDGGE